MTNQTREAFEAFLATPAPDEYDASNADAWHIWQAATKHAAKVVELMTERRRMNSSQKPDCEYAAAIRQGGEA